MRDIGAGNTFMFGGGPVKTEAEKHESILKDQIVGRKDDNLSVKNTLEQFKPKPGSRECDTCLVPNGGYKSVCAACGAKKPGNTFPIVTPNVTQEKQNLASTFGGAGKVSVLTALGESASKEKPLFTFGTSESSSDSQKTTPLFSFGAHHEMPIVPESPATTTANTFTFVGGFGIPDQEKSNKPKTETSPIFTFIAPLGMLAPRSSVRSPQKSSNLFFSGLKSTDSGNEGDETDKTQIKDCDSKGKTLTTDVSSDATEEESLKVGELPKAINKPTDKETQVVVDSAEKSMMTDSANESLTFNSGKLTIRKEPVSEKNKDEELVFVRACEPTTEEIKPPEKLVFQHGVFLFEREPEVQAQWNKEVSSSKTLPLTNSTKDNQPLHVPKKNDGMIVGDKSRNRSHVFGAGNPQTFVSFAQMASSASGGGFGSEPSSQGFSAKSSKLFDSGLSEEHELEQDEIHFQPVIPLPEMVEVVSGEEEEIVLFSNQAKLYRYDKSVSQWKERGAGDIKILKHKKSRKTRIFMRQEQIHKICANHFITVEMQLKPNASSNCCWVWETLADFSDEIQKAEQLAVRFKMLETAQEFKSVFEECQRYLCKDTSSADEITSHGTPEPTEKDDYQRDKEDEKDLTPSNLELEITQTKDIKINEGDVNKSFKDGGCRLETTKSEATSDEAPNTCDEAPATNKSFESTSDETRNTCDKAPATSKTSEATSDETPNTCDEAPATNKSFEGTSDETPNTCDKAPATSKTSEATSDETPNTCDEAPATSKTSEATSDKAPASSKTSEATGDEALATSKTSGQCRNRTGNEFIWDEEKRDGGTSGKFCFGSSNIARLSFQDIAKKSPSESSLFGSTSKSKPKPFSGAGEQLSQSNEDKGDEEKETNDESGDHIYFEPVIPLPEKVVVKTGEENEQLVFNEHCKLYRFECATKQWKERGVGDIKLLLEPNAKRARVVMRREQIHKICANHLITDDMELKPNASSEKSWVWHTMADMAEGEPNAEQLAVRFKNPEIARKFKEKFDYLKGEIKGFDNKESESSIDQSTPDSNGGEMISPKGPTREGGHEILENIPKSSPDPTQSFTDQDISTVKKEQGVTEVKEPTTTVSVEEVEDNNLQQQFPSSKSEMVTSEAAGENQTVHFVESSQEQKETALVKPLTTDVSGFTKGVHSSSTTESSSFSATGQASVSHFQSSSSMTQTSFVKQSMKTVKQVKVTQAAAVSAAGVEDLDESSFSPTLKLSPVVSPILLLSKIQELGARNPEMTLMQLSKDTRTNEFQTEVVQDSKETHISGQEFMQSKESEESKSMQMVQSKIQDLGGHDASKILTTSKTSDQCRNRTGKEFVGDEENRDDGNSEKFFFGSSNIARLSIQDIAKKSPSESSLFSSTSKSKPKPFSGAGEQLFQSNGDKGDEEKETNDESGDHIYFEPVIPLPEKVVVKTGEENEQLVFNEHCKLYRFECVTKQWKERGVGDIKLLLEPNAKRARVVVRCEQIYKICANHLITADMELKPNAGSEKSWVWHTMADMAEGEPNAEQLAVRFKNPEIARRFKEKFDYLKGETKGFDNKEGESSIDLSTPDSNGGEMISPEGPTREGGHKILENIPKSSPDPTQSFTDQDIFTVKKEQESVTEVQEPKTTVSFKEVEDNDLQEQVPSSKSEMVTSEAADENQAAHFVESSQEQKETALVKPLTTDISGFTKGVQSSSATESSSFSETGQSSVSHFQSSSSMTQTSFVKQSVKTVKQVKVTQAAAVSVAGVEDLDESSFSPTLKLSPVVSPILLLSKIQELGARNPEMTLTQLSKDTHTNEFQTEVVQGSKETHISGQEVIQSKESDESKSMQMVQSKIQDLGAQNVKMALVQLSKDTRTNQFQTEVVQDSKEVGISGQEFIQIQESAESKSIQMVQSFQSEKRVQMQKVKSQVSVVNQLPSCSPDISKMVEEIGSSDKTLDKDGNKE